MRCLSKVVFVNSANVPYAEIRLDGNVHFIGTQGVGKSTLLRAILFFYNGDKLKLGIPKEKKSFDEFYLPYANSYIVYEVSHERGAFCVLVFRSQGRACFRFIDGEWDKRLLVDEAGEVTSEYTVIRKRLGDRGMTRIVDKYEEYRNIIYGNHRATDKEFYNYAIMESPAYENIPRSLQNVFLNSRVDAEFIKEIILRSMNDEIPSVDLAYYRRQVADFETEYKNISEWFRTDSRGEIPVRQQAAKVIEQYRELIYLRKNIEELYAELLYADRTAHESLPSLEETEGKQLAEIQRFERLIQEQAQKYSREKEEVDKELGEVESRIKDAKARRKDYEQKQIDSILVRVDNEANVKTSLDSLLRQKATLTRENESLSAKYEALQHQLEAEFREFESNGAIRKSEIKEQCLKLTEKLLADRQKKMDEIRADYDASKALTDEKAEALASKDKELNAEFIRWHSFRPLGKEIDELGERIKELNASESALRARVQAFELQIESLQKDYDYECSILKSACERDNEESERRIGDFNSRIDDIDKLLGSSSGSLYEWLDANVPAWEKTIGKVIDQKQILYRKGLKPRLGAGSSFYGVELDLSEVGSEVRTPNQLREEREMYSNAILDLRRLMAERSTKLEQDIQALSAKMSPKMKELREKRNVDELSLQTLPAQIKALSAKVQSLNDRQQEMINERKSELESRRLQLSAEKHDIEKERKSAQEKLHKSMKETEKQFEQKRKNAEAERDRDLDNLSAALAEKRTQLDLSIGELKARRDAELKGAGVDILALNSCEQEIRKVRQELDFIESNRELCYQYRLDKRELFDREDEFRDNKRALDAKREKLSDKFKAHTRQLEDKANMEKDKLGVVREEIKLIKTGFDRFEEFCRSELFPSYLNDIRERPTLSMAAPLVEEIRSVIMERMAANDQFKKSVTLFKNHFGPDNIFKFKLNLVFDEDYMDFASDLEEFVEQNKIEDYRGRTSDRYMEILQRVSREIGELSGFGSQVEKIIREINYDFKEKNFVGAIRSIEIRSTDSGDKMVQLLLKIKEFTDDNAFQLGGINLFSEGDSRDEVNRRAVCYLEDLMNTLNDFSTRKSLSLSDTFQLQFRIVENDNDTGWVEKIANVGSDGTDILVKAMVNIMLINVFKEKVSRKFGEFRIHCVMDEIGKLHPNNVKGILDFANSRNILLINSSPTTYNVSDYRYTYLLSKDDSSKTMVQALISRREAALGH